MTQVRLYRLNSIPEVTPWPGRWMLSAQEVARSNRWLNPARRNEFLWGRALMRYVMAQHGVPRTALKFAPGGKPFLEAGGDLNLSHGAGQVLVGYCPEGWLGVDVETHAPRDTTLMERFFHGHERDWMGQDTARLHRLWTVKESALKALGTGVSGNPARVWFDPAGGGITVMDAPVPQACDAWWMEGDGWTAAAVHVRVSAHAPRAQWEQCHLTASDVLGWMERSGRTEARVQA
ncbi:MAG: 4'-phosphopantetheinyl transferase superfamily protein [Deltaproteobacteria bacterium]|nr:4'-phosphopantetheinyl transferase superfamily protein [Deltaproteobacteria bacterium]